MPLVNIIGYWGDGEGVRVEGKGGGQLDQDCCTAISLFYSAIFTMKPEKDDDNFPPPGIQDFKTVFKYEIQQHLGHVNFF